MTLAITPRSLTLAAASLALGLSCAGQPAPGATNATATAPVTAPVTGTATAPATANGTAAAPPEPPPAELSITASRDRLVASLVVALTRKGLTTQVWLPDAQDITACTRGDNVYDDRFVDRCFAIRVSPEGDQKTRLRITSQDIHKGKRVVRPYPALRFSQLSANDILSSAAFHLTANEVVNANTNPLVGIVQLDPISGEAFFIREAGHRCKLHKPSSAGGFESLESGGVAAAVGPVQPLKRDDIGAGIALVEIAPHLYPDLFCLTQPKYAAHGAIVVNAVRRLDGTSNGPRAIEPIVKRLEGDFDKDVQQRIAALRAKHPQMSDTPVQYYGSLHINNRAISVAWIAARERVAVSMSYSFSRVVADKVVGFDIKKTFEISREGKVEPGSEPAAIKQFEDPLPPTSGW